MDEMQMRRLIERKRDGEAIESPLWEAVVAAYLARTIDDAQMAAMLMACVFRGMTVEETYSLTQAMVGSGEVLSYDRSVPVVDKHSTGGVGDCVSLVAVPLVAACGVRVAKLSGRALGHTGGTIDKLEAIPGFDASLTMDAFVTQVQRVGCAIAAQSESIVPADKRLYRLRDRTATVSSVGLIAASIVSKKIAGGADAFAFDVKCGSAAFMRDVAQAEELARTLVELSLRFGRKARAMVTDMEEPLGRSIGSGLEAIEARDLLRSGAAEPRVLEACVHVAAAMLNLGGIERPRSAAERALRNGAAYEKFVEMIEAQGSSRRALEAMRPHPVQRAIFAPIAGFVGAIDAVSLGNLAREISAETPAAGIIMRVRTGDYVNSGDVLATACGPHPPLESLVQTFTIASTAPPPRPLLQKTIG